MLWRSSLKLIKKIATTIVLGAGIFILVCATLKSVFLLVVSSHLQAIIARCRSHAHTVLAFRNPMMAPKSQTNGARARHSSQSSQPTSQWSSTSSECGSRRPSAANSAHPRKQAPNLPRVVSGALVVAATIPNARAGPGVQIPTPLT